MTWIRLDPSSFADDQRWLEAGADAMAVHVSALCYCDRHLTDGAIGANMALRVTLAVHPKEAAEAIDRLVAWEFWEATANGFQIIDYLKHGLAMEEVSRTRDRWAKDKRWRRQHGVGDHALCPTNKCAAALEAAERGNGDGAKVSDPDKSKAPLSRAAKKATARGQKASGRDTTDVRPGQQPGPAEKAGMSQPSTLPNSTRPQGRGELGRENDAGTPDGHAPQAADAPTTLVEDDGAVARPCPHGMAGGLSASANQQTFVCDACSSLAPLPNSTLSAWQRQHPGLSKAVQQMEFHCTDPGDDEVARTISRATYSVHCSGGNTATPSPNPGTVDYLFVRLIDAYVVDHVDPGRVADLLADSALDSGTGL